MSLGSRLLAPLLLSVALHGCVLALSRALWRWRVPRPQALTPFDVRVTAEAGVPSAEAPIGAKADEAARARALKGNEDTKAGETPRARAESRGGSDGDEEPSPSRDGKDAKDGGTAAGDASSRYAALVRERVQSVLQYPVALKRQGVAGRVVLRLVVQPDGTIAAKEIAEGARGPRGGLLNELALAAAGEAEPYPPPPREAIGPGGKTSLSLPIEFGLAR